MSGPAIPSGPESRTVALLRAAMEAVVLAMVALAPWGIGGEVPAAQLGLAVGVAVLLTLWAALTLATGRFGWAGGPIAVCLGGIAVLGLLQLIPVSPAVHRVISPGSAELRAELLPTRPEMLTADESVPPAPPDWPLSFYPYATRVEAMRWLAAFALFAAVRSQVASAAAFRRLCVVVAVNGALLALFGLAHRLSARPGRVFWEIQTQGTVFGPFVYRNHYAAYSNLCFGLAVGLLLLAGKAGTNAKSDGRGFPARVSGLLSDSSPAQVWLWLALALMLGGLVGSLSRGGVAALAAGSAVVLLARLARRGGGSLRPELLLIPAVLLVALLAAVGLNPLNSRLATLGTGDALADERWRIWLNVLAVVPHFPLVGSGYGTLPYVEPVYRVRPYYAGTADWGSVDYAHSDYLHALAEGGAVQMALVLALAVFVLRCGVRAVRRHAGGGTSALAAGGLLAVVTLAVHAVYDFVLPNPAVAVLAVVIVAHLAALAGPGPPSGRLAGPGRAGVALGLAAVATVVVVQAWQVQRVERLRYSMRRATRAAPPDYDRAAHYLTAAARVAPDDAQVWADLGQLYLDVRQDDVDARRRLVHTAAAAGLLALPSQRPALVIGAVSWPAVCDVAAAPGPTPERYVVPALRCMAEARAHCPLLPLPHLRFAAHAAGLARADPPAEYWDRARRLVPYDPELWYLAGVQSLRDGRPTEAAARWRRSLQLSDRYFNDIMAAAVAAGGGARGPAVADVLPDEPELLTRAALRLDPDARPDGPARPLLERAASVLSGRPEPRPAANDRLAGYVSRLLGRDDAAAAYERAVLAAPERWDWRLEYARVLVERESWDRAADELRLLVGRSNDRAADDLLNRVERERAVQLGPADVVAGRPAPPAFAALLAAAPPGPITDASQLRDPTVRSALAATVRLTHPVTRETGTAVAVARDGNFLYLLTAAHVAPVQHGDELDVQFFPPEAGPLTKPETRKATVKARAPDVDLAVLWVAAPEAAGVLPLCPPSATRGRRTPMPALTVGCDRGAPTAIVDRVRGVRFVSDPYHANFFETDLAQSAGRSGGPLVDERGYVIGICSGTRGGRGYYVATSEIHHVLREHAFDRVLAGAPAEKKSPK